MTQKPPKFTAGTVDLDDEDGSLPEHAAGHAPEDIAAPEEAGAEYAEHDLGPDEGEIAGDEFDLDADMEARKRRAKVIFYGVTAVIISLFAFVGYTKVAPLFHQTKTTAVAVKAPVSTPPAPNQMAGNNNVLPLPPASSGAAMPGTGNNAPSGMPGMPAAGMIPSQPAGQMQMGQNPAGPGGTLPAMANNANPAMPGTTGGINNPSTTGGIPFGGTPAGMPGQPAAAVPAANTNPPPVTTTPVTKPPATSASAFPPANGQANNQPPAQMPNPATPANPVASLPAAPAVAASDPRVDDLAGKVATLQASQKATATQLQQIQASLDAMQKQLSQAAAMPVHSMPAKAEAPATPVPTAHPAHHETAAPATSSTTRIASGSWVLRSATPGGALLGHASTGELQRVAVGDVVTGLGRITYIGEKNGRWVVQGDKGSVGQ